MDETDDHEPRVVVTTTTTTTTTTTSTETQIEKVGEGEGGEIEERRVSVSRKVVVVEEGGGGACEGGDVMVEVLGSEVFVDGVRRQNGEAGSGVGDVGGDDGAGGGHSAVIGDIDEGRLRDNVTSYAGEDLASAKIYESVSGSGVSLEGLDGLRDGETHGVDRVRVAETGIDRGLEGNLGDEGGLIEMELTGNGDYNETENIVQHSTSTVMSMDDGNKGNDVAECVDAVMKEGEAKVVEVVQCASVASESRAKEEGISEKGGEQGVSAHNTPVQDNELTMGSPTMESKIPNPDALGLAENSDAGTRQGGSGVAWFDSNMEDIQDVQENADILEEVELSEQEEDEELSSDSTKPWSKDENEELEFRTAHEQLQLLDESFVEDVDRGKKYAPVTSPDDESAMVGSDLEGSYEVQEEVSVDGQGESADEQKVDEDLVSGSTNPPSREEKNGRRRFAKCGNLVKDCKLSYQLPPENEGEFSVFDLVWGKVKSHPWWPGQIFHPFDSSVKAKKYIRKDCYLVAYFGDRSFAWNDGSVLKPFFKHFSQEEKQSNSESFQNAVTCALEEVSRRVELGLACSCISEEVYDKIKYQVIENAGICEESSKRGGVDWSTDVNSFQPGKLIKYVKALALSPTSRASRLDLVIAKAQLLAFHRLKGCDALADFQYYDGLMECDADTSLRAEHGEMELVDSVPGDDSKTTQKGPRRRKHDLKDIVYQRRKEKTFTELMGDTMYYFDGDFDSHEEDDVMLSSPTTGTKRKASPYPADDFTGQHSTKTISVAKVSHSASPNPQQSFKVGECIRRVASQLTGSSPIVKITNDESNIKHLGDDVDDSKHLGDDVDEVSDPPDDSLNEDIIAPKMEDSTEELLSQLHLSARDPMKGYSFLPNVVSFFSEFRNLAVSIQRQRMRKGSGRKRKPSVSKVAGAAETFEFDDRNDSYWTDMVIQNNSEAKPSRRGRKRKEDRLLSPDAEKPLKSNPRKYSRKQYFHGHESAAEVPSGNEKQHEELPTGPTELLLNFSEGGSIPSEVNLNKMFRRFGPLKESETEIDVQSSRAKVVFKKRSDAEVAYSSAAMFNIFGSALVNYQINYRPLVPSGTAPLPLTDGQEDAT